MGDLQLSLIALGALVVLVILLAAAWARSRKALGGREGYLIYPYLDLDEPGERGSYYAMMQCRA